MQRALSLEQSHPWPLARPAGWWRRWTSLALDLNLLFAVGILAGLAIWFGLVQMHGTRLTLPYLLRHPKVLAAAVLVWTVVLVAIWWVYFVLLRAACGRTCGEAVWGIRLVDRTGGPPGIGACVGRGLCALLSFLILGAGYWWSLWDPQGRTWHDRLSGTRLVEAWPRRSPLRFSS